jgi:aryl-alcohol dehydrogenase-like predicted oxidoreductase
VAIVGSRRAAHIEDAVGAPELRLSEDELAAIDRLMAGAAAVGGPSPDGIDS